jgi:hypothetical protein
MSFCDQCGSSVEDGDKFCTSCGAAVAASEASAESAETYNAGIDTEQVRPASIVPTQPPEAADGNSSSPESELATDPWRMPSRKVLLLISAALVVFFGGVAYGIVHATTNGPPNATSSSASNSSKTTTTTTAPTTTTALTTTTKPSAKRTSLSPGFASNVPPALRTSILILQPNFAAEDTFVSIVKDPSFPSWIEVCAQDAGPTATGAATGYAEEVDSNWNFIGFRTAWKPPFPLGLKQTIISGFAACPRARTSGVVPATTTTVLLTTTTTTTTVAPTTTVPLLTQQQQSAVAEANQYLDTEAFSRQGLIDQLDSPDGGGYSVNDATVAVDSLTTNWNTEAVQAAKEYLQTEPFSCNDLIQQLDSPDGSEFTVAQATYGAQQSGDC